MHIALYDNTNKRIEIAEEIPDEAEAKTRAKHLALQADLNAAGCNPEAEKGADWQVYLGEKPFAFPTPEEEAEQKVAAARGQRNGLLAASDWTQMVADSPLSDKQRAAWATYRQKLRDLPAQKGFPDIDFPVAPGA
jgi:hypothetical protein